MKATKGKRKPKRPQRSRLPLRWLAVLLLLVSVLLIGVFFLYPNAKRSGSNTTFTVLLRPELTLDEAVQLLAESKVIEHPQLFLAYLRLTRATGELRQGHVVFGDSLTPREVARRLLAASDSVPVRVTVPEGMTRFDIAQRLQAEGVCGANDFLRIVRTLSPRDFGLDVPESAPLEGYLYPDTYEFLTGTDPENVAEQMARNFATRTDPLFERSEAALLDLARTAGMTRHDVVRLASIVEKEAAVAQERPIIAGVFLNRLRDETFRPRARLQADPTVTYGCRLLQSEIPSCVAFDGRQITRAMLDDSANPYNTYRHAGLTPTPISNPGLAALEAVLRPAQHSYLYFVAKGGGRHEFTETLEAHHQAVDRFDSN